MSGDALEDASREARAAKDALRHLEASSSERDELLAETLLTHEQLEIELDRATRALRRRGALVPTREAEARDGGGGGLPLAPQRAAHVVAEERRATTGPPSPVTYRALL